MKISKLTTALTFVILALSSGLALNPADAVVIKFDEYQITTDVGTQEQPDINGINIVWQDNRNGNWDIYMYTLEHTFTPETQITNNSASQTEPAICDNKIVYQDDRNGNWDIYMYDIATKTETQITNNTANQEGPDIDGNIIVWQDKRSGDPSEVYMYDLLTQTERSIANYTEGHPSISGNTIVYVKLDPHYNILVSLGRYIYCYDISAEVEREIYQGKSSITGVNKAEPVIDGTHVVWEGRYRFNSGLIGGSNVYMRDVVTTNTWDTVSDNNDHQNPDIYEDYIVYQDDENGNWDIYLYNLDSGVGSRVTTNTGSQEYPAVFGGRIVYMDYRNGNWDIYMTMISYTPETVSPPPYGGRPPQQALPPQNSQNEITDLFFSAARAAWAFYFKGTTSDWSNTQTITIPDTSIPTLTPAEPSFSPTPSPTPTISPSDSPTKQPTLSPTSTTIILVDPPSLTMYYVVLCAIILIIIIGISAAVYSGRNRK